MTAALSLQTLKERFNAADTAWLIFRTRAGRLVAWHNTRKNRTRIEKMESAGATYFGRCSGISRRHALKAARRRIDGR